MKTHSVNLCITITFMFRRIVERYDGMTQKDRNAFSLRITLKE